MDLRVGGLERDQPQLPTFGARQNWIFAPLQDGVLIIAAPLLVLAAALLAFQHFDAVAATTLILTAHVVFTVAHHLPTFIRVYGDVDLFRRYRWSFVLGPVIPLAFSCGVLGFLSYKGYPLEYFLYVYLFLALWDPWHFLRQHYGFMRIYDRSNAAPRALASSMDWWLCVSWFAYIMLESGSWLAMLLEDFDASADIPLLLVLPVQWVSGLTEFMRMAALLTSALYVAYLTWCWKRGYFVSVVKLALFVATFGAMYIAYTPNSWVLELAPEWSFKVGFAAIGIVHMTQYVALVWRYNRNLAVRPQRSRGGLFASLHRRGGWLVGTGYVVLCLAYGEFLTTPKASDWLMSILLALGFTSTLMHYYFDGFIWKMRHQQNNENLAASPSDLRRVHTASWWNTAGRSSAGGTFARQLLYFALPLSVLTVGALAVWREPSDSYIPRMYEAQELSERGEADAAVAAAEAAYAAMTARLPIATKLSALDASAARDAELAYLIYNHSHYRYVVLPTLAGRAMGPRQRAEHRANVALAVERLERAIDRNQPVRHSGREHLSRADAQRTVIAWRGLLDSI